MSVEIREALIDSLIANQDVLDQLEKTRRKMSHDREVLIWALFSEMTGLNKDMVVQEGNRVGVIFDVGFTLNHKNEPRFYSLRVQLVRKDGEVGGNCGYFDLDKVKKLADNHEEYFNKIIGGK